MSEAPSNTSAPLSDQELQILKAVRNLKYGTVEVTVHDGHIMEVSRREKIRFQPRNTKQT